jgi:hypothetical protein
VKVRLLPLLVLAVLVLFASDATAGPIRNLFRGRHQQAAPCCPCQPPCPCQPGVCQQGCPPSFAVPAPIYVPQQMPARPVQQQPAPQSCPDGKCPLRKIDAAVPSEGADALDELNAKRAAKGLRPYIRDEGLTRAARACAAFRAQHRLFGHVEGGRGDFAFAEPGVRVDATGCAAYPAHMGFLACAMWDDYTHAGAISVPGSDGRSYHHLFVSYGPGKPSRRID